MVIQELVGGMENSSYIQCAMSVLLSWTLEFHGGGGDEIEKET